MKSEIKETPYHGNLMKKIQQKTDTGKDFTKTVEASDIILSEFQAETEKLDLIPIKAMEIREKQLDQPLGLFKSILASIASINTTHKFLVFETDNFLITVDFYVHNRLLIRLGDKEFVYQPKKSQQRANSVLAVQKNGLHWRCSFLHNNFTVGKLLNYLLILKMRDFHQITNNGWHFSREIYRVFQDEYGKQR